MYGKGAVILVLAILKELLCIVLLRGAHAPKPSAGHVTCSYEELLSNSSIELSVFCFFLLQYRSQYIALCLHLRKDLLRPQQMFLVGI